MDSALARILSAWVYKRKAKAIDPPLIKNSKRVMQRKKGFYNFKWTLFIVSL